MKMKALIVIVTLTVAGYLLIGKKNPIATSEAKPLQWLNKVKDSLPLPRILKSQSAPTDYSQYSLSETEEEIKKVEALLSDAKTIEELNRDKNPSGKRDEMEALMHKKNALTDHLLEIKTNELSEKAEATLQAQQEIIQNSLKDMENE